MDKSISKSHVPKGEAYCDTPGTSCMYSPGNICINCGRPRGWRVKKTGSRVIRVDNDVMNELEKRTKGFETPNSVIRRALGMLEEGR